MINSIRVIDKKEVIIDFACQQEYEQLVRLSTSGG
jgi:hypothetical protein